MSTTKFEHVIGRDGLHRIRKTRVENGEIFGNTHEGMVGKIDARINECINFESCLELIGLHDFLVLAMRGMLDAKLHDIPTVDERDSEPVPAEPAADSLRHERVFGKPADPFEPQTPCPVEPQLR